MAHKCMKRLRFIHPDREDIDESILTPSNQIPYSEGIRRVRVAFGEKNKPEGASGVGGR